MVKRVNFIFKYILLHIQKCRGLKLQFDVIFASSVGWLVSTTRFLRRLSHVVVIRWQLGSGSLKAQWAGIHKVPRCGTPCGFLVQPEFLLWWRWLRALMSKKWQFLGYFRPMPRIVTVSLLPHSVHQSSDRPTQIQGVGNRASLSRKEGEGDISENFLPEVWLQLS